MAARVLVWAMACCMSGAGGDWGPTDAGYALDGPPTPYGTHWMAPPVWEEPTQSPQEVEPVETLMPDDAAADAVRQAALETAEKHLRSLGELVEGLFEELARQAAVEPDRPVQAAASQPAPSEPVAQAPAEGAEEAFVGPDPYADAGLGMPWYFEEDLSEGFAEEAPAEPAAVAAASQPSPAGVQAVDVESVEPEVAALDEPWGREMEWYDYGCRPWEPAEAEMSVRAVASQPTAAASQPTPTAAASQPTPTASASQPTPVAATSQPTPIAAASQPTPVAAASQPTPTAAASQPTSTEPIAQAEDDPYYLEPGMWRDPYLPDGRWTWEQRWHDGWAQRNHEIATPADRRPF